ncbi:TraC family protein [Variovorax sp. WDL1]|nr:IncF plasmid conjugative transfer pilus assembly protein TraC [Variovorax sp. WDL1]
MSAAAAMTDRESFSSLFTYRFFDDETNFMYLDDGHGPAIGFLLAISPLNVAGVNAEGAIEAAMVGLPPESVLQFGKLVTPQVEGFVNTWANARLAKTNNPLLRQIVERRRDFLLTTALGPSMLPRTRMHPRMMQWYVAARVPFTGDVKSEVEMRAFRQTMRDCRNTVASALSAVGMQSMEMAEVDIKFLLWELLNPHLEPSERIFEATPGQPVSADLMSRNTRVSVLRDGRIGFSKHAGDTNADGEHVPDVVVSCLTVDAAPHTHYLPSMARTLGDPMSWDDRITCPYWAYTTVHILHPDDSKDDLLGKFGMLNKQTMSESQWFRSMMGHLYERRDRAEALLKETSKGHRLVRAYTGINLYTPPDEARQQTERVKGFFRGAGFRISDEPYISLPVFIASLPLQYVPAMDPPNRGMQRAWLMSSINAASMMQVQGDWRGTGPEHAGLLLTSRSGQLATFDLLWKDSTNYNFVVVAASGSGKSFLTNELVCDFLSRGGIARIIDVGRSYHRFCTVMGGENLVFDAEKPRSMNPFTGINTVDDLNELMPMLKELLRLMAFPLTKSEDVPQFQYQLLEIVVEKAWRKFAAATELKHVVEELEVWDGASPELAHQLAMQLMAYSHGRYSAWFTGPREVSFNKPLVVIELEELKQDPQLQSVVLQLVMFQCTKEMYLSDRALPKLLAIDEAWDLMGGLSTGKFIETAFRRMRKYNGVAGVITQSFQDFTKSEAAMAAVENAAWQFILHQKKESIDYAVDHKRISADEATIELIKSVKSGEGFSEVFVRNDAGAGVYRFVTDKHSYYTFSSRATDIIRLNKLTESGMTLEDAIDKLAMEDYARMWGGQDAA